MIRIEIRLMLRGLEPFEVNLPSDTIISDLIEAIIKRYQLEVFDPYKDRRLVYDLWHESSGDFLDPKLTLSQAHIKDGDRLDVLVADQSFTTWSFDEIVNQDNYIVIFLTLHKGGFTIMDPAYLLLDNLSEDLKKPVELTKYLLGINMYSCRCKPNITGENIIAHVVDYFDSPRVTTYPDRKRRLFHRRTSRYLKSDQNLSMTDVKSGDVLDVVWEEPKEKKFPE